MLEGRDALCILPTGYGKSLIYQAAAAVLDRPVVTVSPLLALIRDQERALRDARLPVVRFDSTLRAAARRHHLERIGKGRRLVVLTTPESLENEEMAEALRAARPAVLCVDEAHCITEWGHDFRPAYLRLGAQRRAYGIDVGLALTATATPRVADDIVERLDLRDPLVIRAPPHRKNLELRVVEAPGNLKFEAAGRLLRRLARPGLVYCATTKAVDELHAALTKARVPVARYHGKMTAKERAAAQRRFMRPSKPAVMVATNAFGMGIDKADIRYVMHFQSPGSPEQYVQEAGRAGRDGKRARCVLLYDPEDLAIHEYLADRSRPSGAQLRRIGEALAAYADERKDVASKELALAARAPATVTRSAAAQLEELGLLTTRKRRWVPLADADTLRGASVGLAERFEVIRREDGRRLRAMAAYAAEPRCRSIFLRRWFGESDPPRCGRCDRCRSERSTRKEAASAVRRAKRAADRSG